MHNLGLFFIKKKYLLRFSIFIFVSLLTSGVLVISLLRINICPLIGVHNAAEFSLDLLAPFIPGGHWRFAHLTQFYWSRLPGNITESSVYMGLSVVFLMCYAWYKRHEFRLYFPSFFLWYGIFFFFAIMALGPVLHVGGKPVLTKIMPYTLLQEFFPPLKLSGCPVRMMVMAMLSASVISAIGLSIMFRRLTPKRVFIGGGILGLLLFFDFLPKPITLTKIIIPDYINLLKNLPEQGGLIDTITPPSIALYYQTIHGKPIGDGYISRYPTSVFTELGKKYQAIQNQDYLTLLAEYNIKYVLTSSKENVTTCGTTLTPLYDSHDIRLYQIILQNYEEIDQNALHPNSEYLGCIDIYDGMKIFGWALIPNIDTLHSKIFILLTDGKKTWKFNTCKIKRPDVSNYYKKGNLYDASGYKAFLGLQKIPIGKYKIGILVENKDKKTFTWTDLVFVSSM